MADETTASPEVLAAMIEMAPLSDDTKEKFRANLGFKAPQSFVLASDKIDLRPGALNHVVPEPAPAAERIRAFEDDHLGKDAVRIGGRIERGSGSPFAAMDPEKKRQYAALEKLDEAEQKLAAAHAALIQADVDHDAALAAAEPKPDGKGPTVEEWVKAGYRAIKYPPSGYESRSTREEIDAAIAKQKPNAE